MARCPEKEFRDEKIKRDFSEGNPERGIVFMQTFNFRGEITLSRLGMGAMRLPTRKEEGSPIDVEKAQEIIDYAVKNGVNYFDTAYVYHEGKSEGFLGKALSKYPRDSFYVADKFNYMANPDYKAQFAEQLGRLQMDRIDFYLLHAVSDDLMDKLISCGCIDYFDRMKAEGKIRYFGFSFHGTPDALRKMLALHQWDFVQIQLNYYDWMFGDAKELYEILEQTNIPVTVMEPVRGGRLAMLSDEIDKTLAEAIPGCSVASWALRWLMRLPQVGVTLSGMSSLEQIKDNVATFSEYSALSDEQADLLLKMGAEFKRSISVACTGCRYCFPDCPQGIDIPRVLEIYNQYKLGGPWQLGALDELPEGKRPEDCIGCGSCTGHCPQNIDVPAYMQEMAQQRGK